MSNMFSSRPVSGRAAMTSLDAPKVGGRGRRRFPHGTETGGIMRQGGGPPGVRRKTRSGYDAATYEWRHRVGNFFAKMREYGATAMGYDKTDIGHAACRRPAAAMIVARWVSTGLG